MPYVGSSRSLNDTRYEEHARHTRQCESERADDQASGPGLAQSDRVVVTSHSPTLPMLPPSSRARGCVREICFVVESLAVVSSGGDGVGGGMDSGGRWLLVCVENGERGRDERRGNG